MKTFLIITKITIGGHEELAYYSDYSAALRNATLYVEEADEIEIEVHSNEVGKTYYIFENYLKIKTEKQIGIKGESAE